VGSPFPPLRRWGQNFLVDSSAADRIVAAAAISPGETVVEIGPGDGALTRRLAAAGARLVAVEIDPRRAEALARELAPLPNVAIETGDALSTTIGARLAARGLPAPAAVVGNLPYNVATPILRSAIREREAVSRIVATVQREVARRLVARPGDEDYGYLSVYTAFFAEGEVLFDLQPGAFRPSPKVVSSVVRLRPKKPPVEGERLASLLDVVSRGFRSRRKTLANALASEGGRPFWEAALAAIGKRPSTRAEELSPQDFVALAAAAAAAAAKPHPLAPSPGGEGEDEKRPGGSNPPLHVERGDGG
jgi:16S rRNA (adenine1518-N6/adenine1519-N6)-dimethyltransferase